MRSPRPAAKIKAFMVASERIAEARRLALEPVEQACERQERTVALGDTAHILHEARRVGEILRLAIAILDAREDSEHLEVALQSHPLEGAIEVAKVLGHRQLGRAGRFPVPHGPVEHALLIPTDEG